MTVRFLALGVPLFKATGVPAMDIDCCCECEGYYPAQCECLSGGDWPSGTIVPATLQVTIPSDFSSCSIGTLAGSPPCPVETGINMAGTYVVICNDDVFNTNGNTFYGVGYSEQLQIGKTFICSRSGYDYYIREGLFLNWIIPPRLGSPATGASEVHLLYDSAVLMYTAGADPDTATPFFSQTYASRLYIYNWPEDYYLDECGVGHQKCSELELVRVDQGGSETIGCSHSQTAADYTPTIVWIGTI